MINILIVDDVALIRTNIVNILKNEPKINLYEAESTVEAKRILKSKEIDLIFLDLNLTRYKDKKDDEQNGFEIIRFSKENCDKIPHITIISGTVNATDVKTAYLLGVKDFIAKPYKKEEVMNVVNKIRCKESEPNE